MASRSNKHQTKLPLRFPCRVKTSGQSDEAYTREQVSYCYELLQRIIQEHELTIQSQAEKIQELETRITNLETP